ncbi:MAG: hypothetical protein L0287_28555 [Anaerolineae bacterium]|nr:hypothetical protein [Anaerolineae bacterium]
MRDTDGLIMFGIGDNSRDVFDAYKKAGKKIVFWDKGYIRGKGHFRVAVNGFQPKLLPRPTDRWERLGIALSPMHLTGNMVLFDGASGKYCKWQKLGSHIAWARGVIDKIRQHTNLPIIYRPRPSHNLPLRLDHAILSQAPLETDLRMARVVVSYGGNLGYECIIGGHPHFAIGDSVARALSETDWSHISKQYIPHYDDRLSFAASIAYCQWSISEVRSGEAWRFIKDEL